MSLLITVNKLNFTFRRLKREYANRAHKGEPRDRCICTLDRNVCIRGEHLANDPRWRESEKERTFLYGGLCKTKSTGPTGSPATFYRRRERDGGATEKER